MSSAAQADAIDQARSFASWLLVTGHLTIRAELMTDIDLRLGVVARGHCPSTYTWFIEATERLRLQPEDVGLQWNALMKAAAMTGTAAQQLTDQDFGSARDQIVAACLRRGMPSSGRNMSAIFTRLRLTLFHEGQLTLPHRRPVKKPATVTGWCDAPQEYADAARRYIAQVELSLTSVFHEGVCPEFCVTGSA